jgi:hypothetical protein
MKLRPREVPKEKRFHIPAAYDSTHLAFVAMGQPPAELRSRADFEIEGAGDRTHLVIYFDEIEDGYKQSLTLELNGVSARELAYQLLLMSNGMK